MENLVKGTIAGMIGGAAGGWAMNRFQAFLKKASSKTQSSSSPHGRSGQGGETQKQKSDQGGGDQAATVKLAETISRRVFEHPLSRKEKKIAGPAVHYGYATLMGGIYGAAGEMAPMVSSGLGLPYGAVLWVMGDEIAVPMMGLSKSPSQYSAGTHLSALAAHLVYGVTLELTRRSVRAML